MEISSRLRKDPRDITRSHTTLTSLPSEILTQICLLGSRSTACSLAGVARGLAAAAEPRLWRDLDLTLHPHYAVTPTLYPSAPGSRACGEWANAEAADVEYRRRVALREKVRAVQSLADERTCSMVESVRVSTMPGATYETLQVLDKLSPFARQLAIGTRQEESEGSHPFPAQDQTLLTSISSARWSMTSVTHLHLGKRSIFFDDIFPLLRRLPSLLSLHVHIEVYVSDLHNHYDIETPTAASGITELFIACDRGALQGLVVRRLLALLSYTPAVKRLALQTDPTDDQGIHGITEVLSTLPALEELAWPIALGDLENAVRTAIGGYEDDRRIARGAFTSLRRLLVKGEGANSHSGEVSPWNALQCGCFARIPSLAAIFFTIPPTLYAHPPSSPRTHMSSRTHNILEGSAVDLMTMPRLSVLHTLQKPLAVVDPHVFDVLDEIELSGSPNGQINSLHHDDDVLLFARLYLQGAEIADNSKRDMIGDLPPGTSYLLYADKNGHRRQKVYYWQTEATWQAFTFYRGDMVPMSIIDRMREVEGKSVKEWRGRGIEVGDEAWKILTDWHEEFLAGGAEEE